MPTWTAFAARRSSLRITTYVAIIRTTPSIQLACQLTDIVYELTTDFPKDERYGLAMQMRKASISVISNVAEGQGRLTAGEWRQFLGQARGSLFEVEAQSIVAQRRAFLTEEALAAIRKQIKRTSVALENLIEFVRNAKSKPGP